MDWRDDHLLGTEGSEIPLDNWQDQLIHLFPVIIAVYLCGISKIQETQ